MSTSEDRVNLSLDDIIKSAKASAKAAAAVNKAKANTLKKVKGAKSGNSSVSTPIVGGTAGAAKKKNKKSKVPVAVNAVAMKVAQTIGAGKAKRAAKVDQKRGLNATGKATTIDVKKAVQKVVDGAVKALKNKAKKAATIAKKGTNAPAAVPGLKISFNTHDLNKTTDKNVSAQIRAALSKSNTAPPKKKPSIIANGNKKGNKANIKKA